MKKIIAFVLCVLMLVSCFVFTTSAEDETEELHDISKESLLDCSTQWNYYSAPKYTIDGKIYEAVREGGYEFWRPDYGRNPEFNINDSWIEYRFKDYKEIDTIDLYVSRVKTHRYILKVLVMGEWIEFPAVSSNSSPNYVYTDSKGNKTEFDDAAVVTLDISKMVADLKAANPGVYDQLEDGNITTKKFRIYLKYPDQYAPPLFFETIITGRKGQTPSFDVPDNAELSTNAALSGHKYASSSAVSQFPALAGDNTSATYWIAKNTTDGEWIKSEFDKPYNLSKIELDFAGIPTEKANTFDIEVKLLGADGTWSTHATKTGVTTTKTFDENKVVVFESTGDDVLENIRGIQVIFTNLTTGSTAAINEIIATIADGGKCIFLAGWMTDQRKAAVATGNIAIFGTPYCSSAFDYVGISEISYIIDGQTENSSPCWYAGTMGTGEYCGVVLDLEEGQKANITKVVLNFNDYITFDYYNMITQVRENAVKDDYVLGFELQAKQADGSYKKIASGTSYDTISKSYTVAFDFTDVVTDDIRVVFTSNDAGYAFLKELEVYASDVAYGDTTQNSYCSLLTDKKVAKATAESGFKIPHIVFRAPYMDIISPLASK